MAFPNVKQWVRLISCVSYIILFWIGRLVGVCVTKSNNGEVGSFEEEAATSN